MLLVQNPNSSKTPSIFQSLFLAQNLILPPCLDNRTKIVITGKGDLLQEKGTGILMVKGEQTAVWPSSHEST